MPEITISIGDNKSSSSNERPRDGFMEKLAELFRKDKEQAMDEKRMFSMMMLKKLDEVIKTIDQKENSLII